jgi:Flp pilus assembly protein TadG
MRRLLSCFNRLWFDRRGNIAILFGLAIIPVFGAMGVAVDYSLANASRTALQASLDNTGLMLAKMMPLSDSDLNTRGWQIFQGNLGNSPLVFHQADLVITQTTSTLQLDINTTYNTQLASVLKLVGASTSFPVGAHTQVSWGNSRLRVALVLDNTGSMSASGKIGALKTATTNLINQLKGIVTTPGDVYISIVPFVKDVNVGASNYTANWIDWYDWEKNNQSKGTCTISGFTSQTTCNSAGTCSISGRSQSGCGTCSISGFSSQSTCNSAGICSKSQFTSQSQCQQHSGTWTTGVWTPATWTLGVWTFDHSQWNGCVTDRGTPLGYGGYSGPNTGAGHDQDVSAPSATVLPNPQYPSMAPDTTKFPAEQFSLCPAQQIIPLTYDWTALTNAVNGMSPNGSTNQPIGLVLGWQSLVGGGTFPAAPAMDTAHYTYNQYIILLSDGLNTQDRWYGDGVSTSTQVDGRMYYQNGATISGTCKNIKDAGIKIYTVQVDTGGDPTSTLMQNCASDPSMFFKLTSSSEIVTTFQAIGNALANLHLSM